MGYGRSRNVLVKQEKTGKEANFSSFCVFNYKEQSKETNFIALCYLYVGKTGTWELFEYISSRFSFFVGFSLRAY